MLPKIFRVITSHKDLSNPCSIRPHFHRRPIAHYWKFDERHTVKYFCNIDLKPLFAQVYYILSSATNMHNNFMGGGFDIWYFGSSLFQRSCPIFLSRVSFVIQDQAVSNTLHRQEVLPQHLLKNILVHILTDQELLDRIRLRA